MQILPDCCRQLKDRISDGPGIARASGPEHGSRSGQHVDYDPPLHLPLKYLTCKVRQSRHRFMAGHGGEFFRVDVACEPRLGTRAAVLWSHDGVNPDQRHTAQDMRQNSAWQICATGKPACSNRATARCLRQCIDQRGRADAIDHARPTLFLQWGTLCGEFHPADEAARPKVRQVAVAFGAAGRGNDSIS